MMFRPRLVSPPEGELVTVSELSLHCRAQDTIDDPLLEAYRDAAIAHLDGWGGALGRCLLTQGWAVDAAGWAEAYRLPLPDADDVVITYRDGDGQSVTVAPALYEIVSLSGLPEVRFLADFERPPLFADTAMPVTLSFTAGYGGEAAVPSPIKQAIRLLVSHWFENREAVQSGASSVELPMGVSALIAPYRMRGVLG